MAVLRIPSQNANFVRRLWPPSPLGIPSPGSRAVDEKFPKKFHVHKQKLVFSQVKSLFSGEETFYPQLYPQAVHKQHAVVNRLSTGARRPRVGPGRMGG